MTQLEKLIARAESENDQNLAQAYRERVGDLAADAADLAMAVIRTHAERDAANRAPARPRPADPIASSPPRTSKPAAPSPCTPTSPRSTPPGPKPATWTTSCSRAEARTARSFAENPAREREQARWASRHHRTRSDGVAC